MNKRITVFLACALFFFNSLGISLGVNESKPNVGIVSFTCVQPEFKSKAAELQDIVVEVCNSKSQLTLLDRTKIIEVNQEIARTKDENYINGYVVEQGRAIGAQIILTGVVSNIGVESSISSFGGVSTLTFTVRASFSLQLIDVETGITKGQKTFNVQAKKSGLATGDVSSTSSSDEALNKLFRSSSKQDVIKLVDEWLNMAFPPALKLIRIEDRKKDSIPETVLVKGITYSNINIGEMISVVEIEVINEGGEKSVFQKEIALIKVIEHNGDLSTCKISRGGKVLESKMKDGKNLILLLKR